MGSFFVKLVKYYLIFPFTDKITRKILTLPKKYIYGFGKIKKIFSFFYQK